MFKKIIGGLLLLLAAGEQAVADTVSTSSPKCFCDKDYKWSVLGYYGLVTTTALGQILGGDYKPTGGKVYAVELGYRLADDNPFRRLFGPLVHQIEFSNNVAYINGGGNEHALFEIDPFLMFRWNKFPWHQYLRTSFAIGEGISYATRIPAEEAKNAQTEGDPTKHLINFLILEATVGLPQSPQWQLVTRIHHRSGAYGTYGAGNSGSNALSLGIRYSFD